MNIFNNIYRKLNLPARKIVMKIKKIFCSYFGEIERNASQYTTKYAKRFRRVGMASV